MGIEAAILCVVCAALGIALGVVLGTRVGNPFVGILGGWSIGVYRGESPLRLEPVPGVRQPVLTGEDVTDVPASFVADPFMFRYASLWYLFVEVWNRNSGRGELGVATSADARSWDWRGIVLAEPFHLSYPQVIEHAGRQYLLPETQQANAVRLYRAERFPNGWVHVADLLDGAFTDPTVFQSDGTWYMFAEQTFAVLRLFVARDLLGPWVEHPSSPVCAGDPRRARCAGRVVRHAGRWYRFAQDDGVRYGRAVRAFEITDLSPTAYSERLTEPDPILEGTGERNRWNSDAMHHCDAHELDGGSWIACVDGDGARRRLRVPLGGRWARWRSAARASPPAPTPQRATRSES